MKCPYNKLSQREHYVVARKHDDDNETIEKGNTTDSIIEWKLMDCLKEDCGVWRHGRCCYYVDKEE